MSKRRPATSNKRRGDDTGSVTIELLVVLPALFAVMFLGMQAALYHHARTVAIAAAQDGARAAGTEHGTTTNGVNAALAFVSDAGGSDVLPKATVDANRSTTTATVTVEGNSLSVLPGWTPTVRQTASVPVERLTAPSDEFTNPQGGSSDAD